MARKLSQSTPLGATPLDDISGLKQDLSTREELFEAEFININKALTKYYLNLSSKEAVKYDMHFFLRVHKDMFCDVWNWAGKVRSVGFNVGVEPYKISTELKKLEEDFSYWVEKGRDAIEISALLHHRLVWIHPFSNGNGRWARLITNLYLKGELGAYLEWPEDELFIEKTFRKTYLAALKEADQGNIQPLLEIHKKILKEK